MTESDLQALTLAELLDLNASVQLEFGRRGLARTFGSLQGEVGESLALVVYGGVLPAAGTKAYDLTDSKGRLIQVKTRTLAKCDDRMFQFHNLEFDLAVCILFDRDSNELEWAREYDVDELRGIVSSHAQGPRLLMTRARTHGRDVTSAFRTAFDTLHSTMSS